MPFSHTRNQVLLACLLASGVAYAVEPPPPQADPLSRVEVIGAPIGRTDVHASCPEIDDDMQRALTMAWHKQGRTGVVRVDFVLDGNMVTHVKSTGGPKRYYAGAINRGVRSLSCSSGNPTAPQHYTMLVAFSEGDSTDEAGRPSGNLALLKP